MRKPDEKELRLVTLAIRMLALHNVGQCVLPVVYEVIRAGRLFVLLPDEIVAGTAVDISAATPGGEIIVAEWALQREDPAFLAEILAHEALHIVRADALTMGHLPQNNAHVFNVAADAHIQEWIRAGDVLDVALFGRINSAASDHFEEEVRVPDYPMISEILGETPENVARMTTGEIYERLLQKRKDKGKGKGHSKGCYAPVIDPNNAMTEAEREVLAREVAEKILSRGDVPLGLRRWAERILSGKERDVVRALKSLVSAATRQIPEFERTFQRPSRRLPPELARQGIVLPGRRRKRAPRIVVVVDTSGSMSDSDLANALGLIYEITRAFGEVVVMPTDADVHAVRRVTSDKSVPLIGGGGTDMGEALRRIESEKIPCDVAVVFSDCDTPWPSDRPRFPVLVVHKGNSGSPPPWRHLYIHIP
jgi:predicted metal-dependent peptidase